MERINELPKHSIPETIIDLKMLPVLRIHGLVSNPLLLTERKLASLDRKYLQDDFSCLEGWYVPGLTWSGYNLTDIINLARPSDTARYINIIAMDEGYSVPIYRPDADKMVLCDRMNGDPIPLEHGAPWRLLSAGGACYSSVKWVKELELVENDGINHGKIIALGRINLE